MRKFKKGLLYTVIIIVLLIVAGLSYIIFALPDVGKPGNISVSLNPQRIARGEYLVNHVVLCVDCHSKRDWSKFAGPTIRGTLGGGGEIFDESVGFPGSVYVPNITPYNIKDWTDGELFRAITCGVRKDGSAIFPLMPWPYYSKMSREDVYSIIAYLHGLKPIATSYPKSILNFPLNIIVHTMPRKAVLGIVPSTADTLKYGAYMTQSAACMECHTQDNNGKLLPGMEFAGGKGFTVNGKVIHSANITPDRATGIGDWTSNVFVQKFKAYGDPAKAPAVSKRDFQTIMPWYDYSGMTDTDLKAIYVYLRTIKSVKNKVVNN